MTRAELVAELLHYPPDMEVEILDNDGLNSSGVHSVDQTTVTRGIALPQPHVYDVIVLSRGMEGL